MLKLPPTDSRNWYRQAFVHALDCPHGNWWFLPWHRAYLSWFERTCRELSGDPSFALPYWDWTKTQRIPTAMFGDVLDPNHDEFIAKFGEFKLKFEPVVTAMYAAFTPAQRNAIQLRGYLPTASAFLNVAENFLFFNQPEARGRTAANAEFDSDVKLTVDIDMIRAALQAQTFSGTSNNPEGEGFGSGITSNHFEDAIQGILESQPHNNVHGALGTQTSPSRGFMVSHFSPVDPIFYLHHANIDRLWDVWTRRQSGAGRPTLPEGADLAKWSNEEFHFFGDEKGQPVTRIKAGEYGSMTPFDYDYSRGSGEDETLLVTAAASLATVGMPNLTATVTAPSLAAGLTARSVTNIPASSLQEISTAPRRAVARVTLNLSQVEPGRRFRVLVSLPGGGSPVQAGTIAPFGAHGHHAGARTFTVPLPRIPIPAAAAGGTSLPLEVSVVPIEAAGPAPASGAGHAGHGASSTLVGVKLGTN